MSEPILDSIVTSVINSFKQRAIFGKQKYGTDLDRKDLATADWIQHAQEELMDAILYLEKLKKTITHTDQTTQMPPPSATSPPSSSPPAESQDS